MKKIIIIVAVLIIAFLAVGYMVTGSSIALPPVADGIEWLYGQFGTNEFLVGTTIPFLLGGAYLAAKSALFSMYGYIVRNFTVTVRMNSTTENFYEVNEYVFENFVWGIFRRNFVLSYFYEKSRLAMTAGYGRSIALVHGRPGFVQLVSEDSDSYNFKEYLEIKVMTFRPSRTADELFAEVNAHVEHIEGKDYVDVYKSSLHRENAAKKPKRPMSTIFLPEDLKARVLGTLSKFEKSEKSYVEKGLPWHFGMIFHGEPGTGKTSFIHAIASELGRDIHYHTNGPLANIEFDAAKTILVLEDFDSADFETASGSKKTEPAKAGGGTLSDTLNFLDGFLTPHGMIVIATTNHLDRLDAAVIRPGRFDLTEEIPLMAYKEYCAMCEFYDVTPGSESEFTPDSGAKLMADIKQQWQSVELQDVSDE